MCDGRSGGNLELFLQENSNKRCRRDSEDLEDLEDFTDEITTKEKVHFLPSPLLSVPTRVDMRGWIVEGRRKSTIEDETSFCSSETLEGVLKAKNVFDNLEEEEVTELRTAQAKCNPYELIRGAFFQNRSAIKMANIDAALRFQLTNPTDKSGKSLVPSAERLYFADICFASGGFSEYVLWRKKETARGFGFTLEGGQDFTLEDSRATSSQLFEPFYGDVCDGKQLREFHHRVMTGTGKTGVHLVMADGDIPVDGKEEIQEILYKRLYTSQFFCALMVLRAGGYFVCKMWDTFTPYTVGLIHLMYRAFKHIAIFKPVTSRAETSERYLICHGKRSNCSPICEHLFDVIQRLASNETSDVDVIELVPLSVIQEDPVFCEFIRNNNEIIGIHQRTSLMTIYRFALLNKPYDPRQSEVRAGCLKAWNIPNDA